MIEGFGIPAPGQTIMIASGVLAAQGQMRILAVVAVAYVAATLGDNIGYAIGRFGGRQLVTHHGRFIGLKEKHLDRIEQFFQRYGGGVVVIARFIDVLRQTDGIGAGLAKMRWWHFAMYDAIGCALWVGGWSTVAYLFGENLDTITAAAGRHPAWLIGGGVLIVLLIGGAVVYRLRGRIFGHRDR